MTGAYRTANGRTASVSFFFPRAAGEQPLITLDDQEVEVAVKFPAFEVKRKFKLKEMMFDGKLEM